MPDTNLTDITILLDRTGSMGAIRDDTIGGFNAFLEDQQQVDGEALLTLVQFDTTNPHEVVHRAVPIRDVSKLSRDTYVPRAATPLLDAIGWTVNVTGKRLSDMPEPDRPGKVVFVILTDGLENSSKEFTLGKILKMIRRQMEEYSWQFVFLGADQDAIREGSKLGVRAAMSMKYAKTKAGVASAWMATGSNLRDYRTGKKAKMTFEDKQRKDADS